MRETRPDREFGGPDGPSTPLLNVATGLEGLRASDTDREDAMTSKKKYDSSWDRGNEKLWEKKYREWKKRDWIQWFKTHLSFPFDVERKEDAGDACFSEEVRRQPFRLGHRMTVLSMDDEYEDDLYDVFVEVREGDYAGYVPLAGTEVVSRDNENFWPVREYAVWWANR